MFLGIGIELNTLAARAKRGNQTQIVQHPQSAIDGVEGHRRHPRVHDPEDRLGIRVFQAGGDLTEDLQTLVCEFEAGVFRGRPKLRDAVRHFVRTDSTMPSWMRIIRR